MFPPERRWMLRVRVRCAHVIKFETLRGFRASREGFRRAKPRYTRRGSPLRVDRGALDDDLDVGIRRD